MTIIDKLGLICLKDKKLLTARSKNKELYYVPGGKRELGESDEGALIREIREELLVEIDPESLMFLGSFEAQADEKPLGTIVKITCYSAKFIGNLKANAEIEEIAWLSLEDINKCSLVTQEIMKWLKSQDLL